jgi:hypothetical protein
MSKTILNIVLTLVFLGLVYVLATMIYTPIEFQEFKDAREKAVATQLKKIRTAQTAYKSITGKYADDFDSLAHVLQTGQFKIVTLIGDPDAGTEVIKKETFVQAADSMATLGLDITSKGLSTVPGEPDAAFEMKAAKIEYQSTNVQVVEVRIPWKDFMGKFADSKYKRYDSSYNPDDPTEKNYYLKFGDMNKPTLNANWSRFGDDDKSDE